MAAAPLSNHDAMRSIHAGMAPVGTPYPSGLNVGASTSPTCLNVCACPYTPNRLPGAAGCVMAAMWARVTSAMDTNGSDTCHERMGSRVCAGGRAHTCCDAPAAAAGRRPS